MKSLFATAAIALCVGLPSGAALAQTYVQGTLMGLGATHFPDQLDVAVRIPACSNNVYSGAIYATSKNAFAWVTPTAMPGIQGALQTAGIGGQIAIWIDGCYNGFFAWTAQAGQ
jgi:hypothetical protein